MNLLTKRLLLRPVKLADKEAIFEYRSDAEANQYQGFVPETIEEVEKFIQQTSREINLPETWFQFVMIEKETEKIIGDVGIHFLDKENKQIELGCTLHKDHQRKGFATEALKKLINYCFHELQKHRIITSIDPDNKSSIKLVERLGFRKEAHFVESLFINGQWTDDMVYALLQKDWKYSTME